MIPVTTRMYIVVDTRREVWLAGPFWNPSEAWAELYSGFSYLPADCVRALPFDVRPVSVTIEPLPATLPGSLALQQPLFPN